MELKLKDLINAERIFATLNMTRGFSSVVAYRISKTVKDVSKELKEYEAQRIKLCEEYAKKDDEGKPIIIPDPETGKSSYDISAEDLIKVNNELNNLQEETVDINIKKVTLEDIDKAGLAPLELELIEFMLDLEEE